MGQVTLRGIRKRYGDHEVIQGIDLDVRDGEFMVFVGPSGCGKSTTLRMIAGLEEISGGDLLIDGNRANELRPADRGAAMVFQSYALYPHMTVAENMGFALKMAGRPAAEIESAVRAAADILHLSPLLDRRPGQLSGGQRQRVAIGRAIVRNPDVFLFDEPLSNLDAELRVEMRIEIARLHRKLGNTMIYVTHDQTEAMTLADTIVVLRAGRIEQVGSPAKLYDDPDNLFVAGFIGSPKMNVLPARRVAGGAEIGGHVLPAPHLTTMLPDDPAIQVGIRPEHLRPARADEPSLPFTVDVTEFLGGTTWLYGRVTGDIPLVIEGIRGSSPVIGTQMAVTADRADMRLFDCDGTRLR
ncbi:MAG: sn-glycerol-3-phosphate ABC transporter ATP-binding protein UgpC [Microvirga sp.]